MVLAPGTRLGSYEIIGPLGAGGMGEVYRACDTAVGREVAIKVLPAVFAQDAERLARFEREARVLGSLNHTNIATLHCVEPAGDGRALVMELVEGSGLGDLMRPGTGMRADEAIAIARQIADALDAAHERGIVHRDLKPANVRITSDGVVKVLDFGLAKSAGDMPSDMTNSPTALGPTGTGVVLGTAPYMSPEQARGKFVDKRADIWAFGCVLYEMLTGRRAFAGETTSDTIAAILEREPDWTALPASTSLAVRRLLQRCLEKDPKRRLRDIGDARRDLEDADTLVPPPPRRSAALGWAAALVMGALAVGLGVRGSPAPPPPVTDDLVIQRLTLGSGVTTDPSLSDDGRLLAFASTRSGRGDLDIWVQQMAGGPPLRITDDATDDSDPDLERNGARVLFRSERNGGGAYLAPALGGPARLIAPEARNPRLSPDGGTIVYWTGQFRGQVARSNSSVFVLPLSGGTPVRLLPDFMVARNPVWAPDGKALLVLALRSLQAEVAEPLDWWYVPIGGDPPVKTGILARPQWRGDLPANSLTAGPWRDAGLLMAVDGALWSVPLSGGGMPRGVPRSIVFGAGRITKPAASRDNLIVFAQEASERVIERAPLTTADAPAPTIRILSDGNPNALRASTTRDGQTIVFERDAAPSKEIYRMDLRSGSEQLVVAVDSQTIVNPTVSPDGRLIGFTVSSGLEGAALPANGTAYVVSVDGGVPRKLCDDCAVWAFTADSRRALVTDQGRAIQLIDPATGTRSDLIAGPEASIARPTLSPDGRWLAFRRVTGNTAQIYMVSGSGGASLAAAEQIDDPTMNGRPAGWSPDSRVLYLLLDTDGSRCLWGQRVDSASGRLIGAPYVVRHFHELGGNVSTSYGNAVTAEGFLYETLISRSSLWRVSPAR